MNLLAAITLSATIISACGPHAPRAQPQAPNTDRPVGGNCEDCSLYLAGMPANLLPETIIAGEAEPGVRLTISGTIYQKDGKTPAPGVVMYLYQTDAEGLYSPGTNQTIARKHGHLRGWIKTGADGRYSFHTILPGAYPNTAIPRHIHPLIKEQGLSVYYMDDFLFDNDPFLTPADRSKQEQRGGSGIMNLTPATHGGYTGTRDIVLGKNIPGYPG